MLINSSAKANQLLLYTFVALSLILLSIEKSAAQFPCYMRNANITEAGDRRTPEQIEKAVLECLADMNKQIENNPPNAALFETRGDYYTVLFRLSQRQGGIESYAEKGLADFSKSIELSPKASAFAARANLRHLIWHYGVGWLSTKPAQERLEHLLRNPNFEKAVSDYLQAIRLSDNKSDTNQYFSNLSFHLYFPRARTIVSSSELLKALNLRGEKYSVWDDFDTALEYAAKSGHNGILNEVFDTKVDWADKLGKFNIVLATLQADEKYYGKDYNLLCDEKYVYSCQDLKKSRRRMISIRRATMYLTLNQPEKALADLEIYFANAYVYECPEPYRLRAGAYRKLGKTKEAAADEQKALELPSKYVCEWENYNKLFPKWLR